MFRYLSLVGCLGLFLVLVLGLGGGVAGAAGSGSQSQAAMVTDENASSSAHPVYEYEPGGELDDCIQTFYDPDMYNWYSMRNTCSFKIHWTSVNPGGSGDIRAGGKASNGQSRAEMAQYSDTEFVFCREGFVPVDGSGRYWRGGPYRCRR